MGKHSGLILAVIFISILPYAAAQVEISRSPVSIQVHSGDVFKVKLTLTVTGTQEGLIVTETLPSGWSIHGASPEIDKIINSQIKWLFSSKSGISNKEITYYVGIPSSASGTYFVQGSWQAISNNSQKSSGSVESVEIHVSAPPSPPPSPSTGGSSSSSQQPPPISVSSPSSTTQEETVKRGECPSGVKKCGEGFTVFVCEDGKWVYSEVCLGECVNGLCLEPEANETKGNQTQQSGIDPTGRFLAEAAPWAGAAVVVVILGIFLVRYMKTRKKSQPKQQNLEKWRFDFQPR
ncbi:MAG: hypothetical protein ISS93_00700 [Candidatus Aenigmarchaeota archaeon]|nr:hypothetical protein [Candidatus Aenigmarchaeota archaeon]